MSPTRSTMADMKANLKRLLLERPGLADVQVVYGDPGGLARKETIRLGAVELGNQDPVSLRAGKRRRQEDYILHILVEVLSKRTPEDSEDRAVTLSAEVEDTLALDPKVGETPNLLFAYVDGCEMDTDEGADGPRTVIDISVRCVGQLV